MTQGCARAAEVLAGRTVRREFGVGRRKLPSNARRASRRNDTFRPNPGAPYGTATRSGNIRLPVELLSFSFLFPERTPSGVAIRRGHDECVGMVNARTSDNGITIASIASLLADRVRWEPLRVG